MKIHTDYIGIKLEPELKRECTKIAAASKLGLSAWIRLVLTAAAQSRTRKTAK